MLNLLRRRLEVMLAPDDGQESGGTLLGGEQPNQGGSQSDGNNTEPGPTNNTNGEGSQAPDGGFLTTIKADVRDKYKDVLTGINSGTELAEKYANAVQKLDGAIIKPGEDASEEELAAYREQLGIPKTADAYELPETDLLSEDFLKEQKEFFLKNGMNNDQAKAMTQMLIDQVQKGGEIMRKANTEARNSALDSLKKEHGDQYKEVLETAQNVFNKYASPDERKYMNESGRGNDPVIINMMARMGKDISGDSLLTPQATPQQQQSEAKERFPNSPSMW